MVKGVAAGALDGERPHHALATQTPRGGACVRPGMDWAEGKSPLADAERRARVFPDQDEVGADGVKEGAIMAQAQNGNVRTHTFSCA